MVRVAVSRPVLEWAVERSGQPEAIMKKFSKISEWLSGETNPTLRELELLAKATHTPFGYLFLPEPPDEILPIPYFRTLEKGLRNRPSSDLIEVIHTIEQRQMWMREYLIEQGYERLEFVGSKGLTDTPENIADDMKNTLGLPEEWASHHPSWTQALRDLQIKIEDSGINVAVNSIVGVNTHRKLDPNEFRGFVLVDEYAPFIFINGADGKAAQMFTIAHELAHVWLGSSAAFDLRDLQPATDQTERLCNRVAAEFLVPKSHLQEFWPAIARETQRYQLAARNFKVSEIVIARRALDLGLISKQEFLDFYAEYQQLERSSVSKQKGGDFYAVHTFRLGRYFAEAVIHSAREGRLLYREAYQLTGLYGRTFEKFAANFK